MENKYCPAGKIECENCWRGVSDNVYCKIDGWDENVTDFELCHKPSKQKPIAPSGMGDPLAGPTISRQKPIEKTPAENLAIINGMRKEEYERGHAAAKAQAVEAVKNIRGLCLPIGITEYVGIVKDDAIDAISAIEVKHD